MAHGHTGSPRVDIAILTVIPPELIAVREALGIPEDARIEDDAGTIAYRGRIHSALARRDYEVVLTCIGRAGNADSASFVEAVIARYRPQAVLLVGIAAGRRGKVRIGDVVLSERVVAYEPAAVVGTPEGGSREELRAEIRPIPHRMSQAVAHYKLDDERLRARFRQGGVTSPPPTSGSETLHQGHVATWPNVKAATIASGEKLLRDSARLAEICSLHGKIEAVEMEAVGVMVSCERNGIPWLVVRGVSDFGDELKDDRFREFASRAAAAVLVDFIEHGLKLKAWKLRRWVGLATGILLLAVAVGFMRMVPRGSELPGWFCGSEFALGLYKSSVFKKQSATHFLVARFQGDPSSETDFSEVVSTQVERALRIYKEEALRNPQEVDVEVPEDSLEIRRVACVIESHEQAEAMAQILDADVVIWGEAFFNPGDKKYTVHPNATLYQTQRSIRRGGEDHMELSSLGHLDLPALRSTEPFLLVQFALGLHFYEQEKYWLAARFFQKSADLVLPKERGVAEVHFALGEAYLHLPDVTRSLWHSRRALESVSGSGSELEGSLISNIGSALRAQGDYAGALEHYRRALAIAEKVLGPEHRDVAVILNNIGLALRAQGDYAGALEHYRRALAIAEKVLGPEHSSVASILNNIGLALDSQGDYAGALEHYRRALAIAEKVLGSEHPDVATWLNNIGMALNAQGDYAGALEHLRRALVISEKALGPEHPEVATIVNNIGLVLDSQGDYTGALEQFRRALTISEKVLGPEHPEVATRLNNIGMALKAQGAYAGALEQFRRALAISEKALGLEHPEVAIWRNNIGLALYSQGDYAGALEQFRRALAITEKALGSEHPQMATTLNNIGMTLKARGDYAGALEQFKHALAIAEKALGPEHPQMVTCLSNMGLALYAQKDYAGALAHYQRALTISEKALGPEHPEVATTLNNIGMALKAQGNYVGALDYLRRALAISEKVSGSEHPDVATWRNNIGLALKAMGDSAGALEQFRRALAVSEKVLGKDHPTTRKIRSNLKAVAPQ
jgi:tetratricopeptide (TPR) repeat protein/nucleoside phosphorylase